MLYQLPMENIETKYKYKPLNISVLKELWSYTPWKIIYEGMERPSRNKIYTTFHVHWPHVHKECIYSRFRWKSQFIVNMDAKQIGNIIKERRKQLDVNQQTLSDLAGVGLNTLVAIERGEGNPQLSTLLTVLNTLGLQLDINLKTLDYETV